MKAAVQLLRIRLATVSDIPALRELIEQSVRVLQREDYSAEQLDAALGTAYGVDTQLIADETYYIVEAVGAAGEMVLAACGGGGRGETVFGRGPWAFLRNTRPGSARGGGGSWAGFFSPPGRGAGGAWVFF